MGNTKRQKKAFITLLHNVFKQIQRLIKYVMMQCITAETNLDMFHHGPLLSIQFGAIRTFEHMNFLLGQVSVKMHIQQWFLGKDCVTHHTLVDHPTGRHRMYIT